MQQQTNLDYDRANPEEIIFKLRAMINALQERQDGRNEQPDTSND